MRESFHRASGSLLLQGGPKAVIQSKLEIMQKFEGFLGSGSSGGGSGSGVTGTGASASALPHYPSTSNHTSPTPAPAPSELVFIVKYFRTSQATFFRFSHRILQVNFFDHVKLIFSQEGREITFIDAERRCLRFDWRISRIHLPSGITGKLQYVSDLFSSMMG